MSNQHPNNWEKANVIVAATALIAAIVVGWRSETRADRAEANQATAEATTEARNLEVENRAIAAEQRAATAEMRAISAEERANAAIAPKVISGVFVGTSPDLRSLEDVRPFVSVQIIPWVDLDKFQNQVSGDDIGYLFIGFENGGAGLAKSVSINNLQWIPKEGASAPVNQDEILISADFALPPLGATRVVYALLVDVAAGLEHSDPMKSSNALAICWEYSYTDILDETHFPGTTCVGETPDDIVTEIMNITGKPPKKGGVLPMEENDDPFQLP